MSELSHLCGSEGYRACDDAGSKGIYQPSSRRSAPLASLRFSPGFLAVFVDVILVFTPCAAKDCVGTVA